jgi:hypothetical protein
VNQPQYAVALSFAGEQRDYVRLVADALARQGVTAFYDEHEEVRLWGLDLAEEFHRIYSTGATFVLIFASREYVAKAWTRHERRTAIAHAISSDDTHILPVRWDDVELPGWPSTIGYLDARRLTPVELADRVRQKLSPAASLAPSETEESRSPIGTVPPAAVPIDQPALLQPENVASTLDSVLEMATAAGNLDDFVLAVSQLAQAVRDADDAERCYLWALHGEVPEESARVIESFDQLAQLDVVLKRIERAGRISRALGRDLEQHVSVKYADRRIPNLASFLWSKSASQAIRSVTPLPRTTEAARATIVRIATERTAFALVADALLWLPGFARLAERHNLEAAAGRKLLGNEIRSYLWPHWLGSAKATDPPKEVRLLELWTETLSFKVPVTGQTIDLDQDIYPWRTTVNRVLMDSFAWELYFVPLALVAIRVEPDDEQSVVAAVLRVDDFEIGIA